MCTIDLLIGDATVSTLSRWWFFQNFITNEKRKWLLTANRFPNQGSSSRRERDPTILLKGTFKISVNVMVEEQVLCRALASPNGWMGSQLSCVCASLYADR